MAHAVKRARRAIQKGGNFGERVMNLDYSVHTRRFSDAAEVLTHYLLVKTVRKPLGTGHVATKKKFEI